MKVINLSAEETRQYGFTTMLVVTHEDLTDTTASGTGTQTLTPIAVAAGHFVAAPFALRLVTPFKHSSDAAQNSLTVAVGDGGSTGRYITATQINENGTEVTYKAGTGTLNMYTAADTIDLLFTGTADKVMANLDTGELHVFCNVVSIAALSESGD